MPNNLIRFAYRRAPVRTLLGAAAGIALLAAPCATAGATGAVPSPAAVGLTPAAPLALTAQAAQATQGLSPGQIHAAYALPLRGAPGQTIAVISAYDDPHAPADLNAYTKRFGLPSCTGQNKCLRKLNQNGKPSPVPSTDPTGGMWNTESALGIEVSHAVCESCSILLVEANTDSKPDFSTAVSAAAKAGATVIVTTFTPTEDVSDSQFFSDYTNRRAVVVAAVGDPLAGQWGYSGNVNFPSALPNVLAIGGTQLRLGPRGGYGAEQAWSGTVSGCSLYQPAPSWQTHVTSGADCGPKRAVADLAAVADPGAIVHITEAGQPGGPWYVAQGTSFAAPIIGGVIGLAGSAGSGEAQMLYARAHSDPGALHDIRTGANSQTCTTPGCHAAPGWDGPTGLGTPAGLEAFLPGGPALVPRRPRLTIAAPGGPLQVGRHWGVAVALRNDNAFRVSGSLLIRRTIGLGGHLRTIQFAIGNVELGSLAEATERLTIDPRYRSVLRRLGRVTVFVQLRAHGAVGPAAAISQKLSLRAP